MRQNIQANVALKTFSGLHFGTARWIQGDRIAFATDAEFTQGARAELRMELSGRYQAVLAEVLVIRTFRIDSRGENGCIAQIMDMPEADSERLGNWLSDLTEGGIGAQPSAWLESMIRSRNSKPAATEEETRHALDRISQRLDGAHSRTATSGGRRGGRHSIREALKASFVENTEPRGVHATQPKKQVEEPEYEATDKLDKPTTNGSCFEGELNGLIWSYNGEKLLLQWGERAALADSWNAGLTTGSISIPLTGTPLEVQQPIRVRLTLPDGQVLALRGKVDAVESTGLICSVNMPWGARVKIQSASKT